MFRKAAPEQWRLHGEEVVGSHHFEAEAAFAPLDGNGCLPPGAAAQYGPRCGSRRLDSGLFEEPALDLGVLPGSLLLGGNEIPQIEAKAEGVRRDRKSTRLNSSHLGIS